jgi:hypothetical protein
MPRNGSRSFEVAPALWVECLKTNVHQPLNFHFFCCPYHVWRNGKKCYDYYKDGFVLTHDQINLLIIGNVIAIWLFSH